MRLKKQFCLCKCNCFLSSNILHHVRLVTCHKYCCENLVKMLSHWRSKSRKRKAIILFYTVTQSGPVCWQQLWVWGLAVQPSSKGTTVQFLLWLFYVSFEIPLFSKLQFKNINGKNIHYLTIIFTGLISSNAVHNFKNATFTKF